MTWNYRLIKTSQKLAGKTYHYYAIHEVFYDKKGEPTSWTVDAVDIGSEDPHEIKDILTTMLIDVHRQPILEVKKVDGKEKLVEIKLKQNAKSISRITGSK